MNFTAFGRVQRLPWERISHALLLGFLVVAVLWHGGRTLEMTWALVGVTWVVLAVAWARRDLVQHRQLPSVLPVLAACFVLLVIASFLTSSVKNYGLDEVFRTVSLALLFFWMARQPEESPIRRRVLKAVAVVALLAAGIGVAVYILQPVNRFTGTFFNMSRHTDYWPNAWAEFVLLAWPIVLLFTYRKSPANGTLVQRAALCCVKAGPLGLLLASLALSYSRAAAIVFLGQIVLLLLWGMRRKLVWKKYAPFIVGSFVVALLVFAGCNMLRARRFTVVSPVDKVLFQTGEGTSSLTERIDFWRDALVLSGERPFLGFGPGSFRFVQPRLAGEFLAVSDHAHNLFLKAAMDSGWPAALLLLTVLLILVFPSLCVLIPSAWYAERQRFQWLARPICTGDISDFGAVRFLPFVGVMGVLAHNLVDFNLQFVGIILPFVLMLGMLVRPGAVRHTPNNKFVHSVGAFVASVLLILAVREGIFISTQILARRAEEQGAQEKALTWYRRSHPSWYPRDLWLGEAKLLLVLGRPEKAREAARSAIALNGEDARGWRIAAEASVALKDEPKALYAAEKAYDYGRMNDSGNARLFLDLLIQQNRESALKRIPEFDALAQKYAAAMQRNAHFVLLSGNVEEFLRLLDVLSALSPKDEPRFQGMAAGMARLAKRVRSQQASAPQGMLW